MTVKSTFSTVMPSGTWSWIRLARLFGTTPEFWIGLQADVSLWDTLQVHGAEYEKIKPVRAAVE